MQVTLANGKTVEWAGSAWANSYGLTAVEAMANYNSATPEAERYIESNLGYSINWNLVSFQEAWNEFVRRTQDNGSGPSVLQQITGAVAASTAFFVGGTTGADAAYQAGSGGSISNVDLKRDVVLDAAGLGVGAAIAGSGLVAGTTAVSTSEAVTASTVEAGLAADSSSTVASVYAAENAGAIAAGTDVTLGTGITTATATASGGFLASAAQTLGLTSVYNSLTGKAAAAGTQLVSNLLRGRTNTPSNSASGLAGHLYDEYPGFPIGPTGSGGSSKSSFTPLIVAGVILILGLVGLAVFSRR